MPKRFHVFPSSSNHPRLFHRKSNVAFRMFGFIEQRGSAETFHVLFSPIMNPWLSRSTRVAPPTAFFFFKSFAEEQFGRNQAALVQESACCIVRKRPQFFKKVSVTS